MGSAPKYSSTATPALRLLPFYVEPALDEALFSWLLRLSSRMGVSMFDLACGSFGVADARELTRWWCRPHPWLLKQISDRTNVSVARLRSMTFEGFQLAYRDDEANARFIGRRYDAPSTARLYRFAVCGPCLKQDRKPYIRLSWLIGWMAVCPVHEVILIERCASCHARLRVAPLSRDANFNPGVCERCKRSVIDRSDVPADPAVIRFQAVLLRAKREGHAELGNVGLLSWQQIVALIDVLLGVVWTCLTKEERERVFQTYADEGLRKRRAEDGAYDYRHGSFLFLTWLTDDWPDSAGAEVAQSLLRRWLSAERNRVCRHLRSRTVDPWTSGPSNFEKPICDRLRELAGAK